jgi:nicotinamide mononucleotide transporter
MTINHLPKHVEAIIPDILGRGFNSLRLHFSRLGPSGPESHDALAIPARGNNPGPGMPGPHYTSAVPPSPSRTLRDNRILASLTLVTSLVAFVMIYLGKAGWLEGVSFVTGAVCVWLTVRENVWNFPIGLLNVATFVVVFWQARLFGDAGLQVVYFVLILVGWYLWLYGGTNRTALRIHRASTLELSLVGIAVVGTTLLLWEILYHHTGGVAFWDALTTAISLGCQWLLNRKRLESWLGWIVVDIIYIPLYCYKGLYLTAVLYSVFLVMACMGFLHWRRTFRAARLPPPEAAA